MTIEERDKWINKKALQRDAKVIAEMMEKTEKVEDFSKCRE